MLTETELANEVKAMIETTAAFEVILRQESASVRVMDLETAKTLAQDKADLAARYDKHILALHESRAHLPELEDELRQNLADAQSRIAEAISENIQTLQAARQATRRVVEMIVDSVSRGTRQMAGYGPAGYAQGGYGRSTAGAAPPLTGLSVNENL